MDEKNTISYWLSQKSHFRSGEWLRQQLVCQDGFTMGVQASEGHYCTPRENSVLFYTHVEVGYPSVKERFINGIC